MFELATDEMLRRFEAGGSGGLKLALAEGVAALDHLGSYCFTGLSLNLMVSALGPLGAIDSMERNAWPFVDPGILSLLESEGSLNLAKWPRRPDGRPLLMQEAALALHYGADVAARRHDHVWFQELGGASAAGELEVTIYLEEFVREVWIPQAIASVCHNFSSKIRTDSCDRGRIMVDMGQRSREGRRLLQKWSLLDYPFSWTNYEPIFTFFAQNDGAVSKYVTSQAYGDFAQGIYEACIQDDEQMETGFLWLPATWLSLLRTAIRHTSVRLMSKEHWINALSASMLSNMIECIPGSSRAKFTFRRVTRLIRYIRPAFVSTSSLGSSTTVSGAVGNEGQYSAKQRIIDFGCIIPFTTIPPVVEDGFRLLTDVFSNGYHTIWNHYQVARQCLIECLGDPICDVMLMMVLTLASSSVTPSVAPRMRCFNAGPRKHPAMFAANLVTRMLWFLRPDKFPWDANAGMALRVSEMTKKIEHKGVSNRILLQLGWIEVVRGRHGNNQSINFFSPHLD
ncbi:hypothetical protein GQ44DRAFT_804304 [Phaeosphaeriaceae sp. PMI808]|nr:hypothetical protein GQ44DRAFT_804304 [Phaeosphaeriaceae sp. PMI808]